MGNCHRFHRLPDLLPQLLAPHSGLGGKGHYRRPWIFFLQDPERAPQLIPGQPVTFGCDHQKRASRSPQEIEQLLIALLGRDIGIHQHDAECEGGALLQVGMIKLAIAPRFRGKSSHIRNPASR